MKENDNVKNYEEEGNLNENNSKKDEENEKEEE